MTWISVKEAAFLMGYSAEYFRREFCAEISPKVPIRQRKGPTGRRRILVLREAVVRLIEDETKQPA